MNPSSSRWPATRVGPVFALVLGVCVPACGASDGPTPSSASTGPTPSPSVASASVLAGVISPEPVSGPALDALPAVPAACPQPPPDADDLRPAPAVPGWKALSTDAALGYFDRLAVGADGAVWATYTSQTQKQGALESTDGGLRRWAGSAWRTFTLSALPGRKGNQVTSLAASSADRAWVVGVSSGTNPDTAGFIGTFDDDRWRVEPLAEPAAQVIGWAGTASGGTDTGFWTVSGKLGLHWDGSTWRSYALPANAGALDGDWAVSGALYDTPAAMRWQGSGWQQVGVPRLGLPDQAESPRVRLNDVVELGPSDVWAVGGVSWLVPGEENEENEPLELYRPVALHWNGDAWTCGWGALGSTFLQAEPDGRGGLWVLDSTGSRLLHLSNGRWTSERITGRISALAARPGTTEIYAVGAVGPEDGPTRAVLWSIS